MHITSEPPHQHAIMSSRPPSVTAIRSRSTSQSLSPFPFHCSPADRPFNEGNNFLSAAAASSPVPLDFVSPSSQLNPSVSKASFFLADVPASTTAQSNLASFSAAIEKSRNTLPFQFRSPPSEINDRSDEPATPPKSTCAASSSPSSTAAGALPNSTPATTNHSSDTNERNPENDVVKNNEFRDINVKPAGPTPVPSPPPIPQSASPHSQRSLSLPGALSSSASILKAVADNEIDGNLCVDCIRSCAHSTLILDIRPYPAFVQSRIKGALNLCVPTTLLKRPSFDLAKLVQTFVSSEDRERFLRWKSSTKIIVYCSTSRCIRDAASSVHVLQKFMSEKFKGECLVLRGGFSQFVLDHPDWVVENDSAPVDNQYGNSNGQSSSANSKIGSSSSDAKPSINDGKPPCGAISIPKKTPFAPVIGGCAMPLAQATPNSAFYGTIRQNTELPCGVGKIPLSVPPLMPESVRSSLPSWLSAVSNDDGTAAAERFTRIEVAEQKRMQQALSTEASSPKVGPKFDSSSDTAMLKAGKIRLAGIEKGAKNRYNNIYPYDHSRVKLRSDSSDLCDYVNANYVQPSRSNKRYIATQAPIPATFNDFWRVVWEQNVGVIVMLTAEMEAFTIKCHQYWKTGRYGSLEIVFENEKHVPLSNYHPSKQDNLDNDPRSTPMPFAEHFAASAEKAAHTPMAGLIPRGGDHQDEITIRTFSLRETSPSCTDPPRTITQIQYTGWPDFGIPARPTDVLSLLNACTTIFDEANVQASQLQSLSDPVPKGRRNIIVHCSAGCGRTGIFCTVDTVIDMLKMQRRERTAAKRKTQYDNHMEERENLQTDGGDRDISMRDVSEEQHRFPLQRKGSSAINRVPSRRQTLSNELYQQQPPTTGLRRQGSKKQKVYNEKSDGYATIPKNPSDTPFLKKDSLRHTDTVNAKQDPRLNSLQTNFTTYAPDSHNNPEPRSPIFSPSNGPPVAHNANPHGSSSKSDTASWVFNDDFDLVAETVEEFRQQRPSMVQTLRQFVLCYDSILEWISLNPWPYDREKEGGDLKPNKTPLQEEKK